MPAPNHRHPDEMLYDLMKALEKETHCYGHGDYRGAYILHSELEPEHKELLKEIRKYLVKYHSDPWKV